MSPSEAHDKILHEGYVYIDVRSVPEYDAGHPKGAYNVPIMMMTPAGMQANPDFLAIMEKRFPKDSKLILGCKAGTRSAKACRVLEQAGYLDLANQRAGYSGTRDPFGQVTEAGWEAQGLPTASDAEAGRDYASLAG